LYRYKSSILLILIISITLSGCLEENLSDKSNIIYVNSFGGEDYITIQEAINASPENYTIFIRSGVYKENIVINKTVIIIGEDKNTTIIDGNGTGDVIYISKDGRANISGLTIKNSGNKGSPTNDAGIDIRSDNNNIIRNNISYNNF